FAAATTLASLLEAEGLAGRRVAVEVNGMIVPRGQHASQRLADGDRVEIVHALGGG
ncbi:MAG: sulfur carrier protein ThiS, partial [Pseudoxanthomonas sp.]|nr:sulfur carrier protein ThiS [Pseudoxanthomonas sp.]